MSVLTLIRHGQATVFRKESDPLSAVGEVQARKLARFWLKNGVRFDEVCTGTLERQKRTERIVAKSYLDAGVAWPEASAFSGFDEYDAPGILARVVPELAGRDERFAGLVRAYEAERGEPDETGRFQRMFETALLAWARGEVETGDVERWPAFRARVLEALQRVMMGTGNRRIAIFTSGGPIGLAVQTAMRAPDRLSLDLHWRLRNCSVTELVFSGDRFTLDSFNGIPHLDDVSLWTYR